MWSDDCVDGQRTAESSVCSESYKDQSLEGIAAVIGIRAGPWSLDAGGGEGKIMAWLEL